MNIRIGASMAIDIASCDVEKWGDMRHEILTGTPRQWSPQQRLRMDMGVALEPLIRQHAVRHLNVKTEASLGEVDWAFNESIELEGTALASTPDIIGRIGKKTLYLADCKFHTGDKSIEELGLFYSPQLQHQMMTSGMKEAWLFALYGHRASFRSIVCEYDADWCNWYLRVVTEFVEYVKTGKLPEKMQKPVEAPLRPGRTYEWTPQTSNAATVAALALLENQKAAKDFDAAKDAFKELVPADAVKLTWQEPGEKRNVLVTRRRDNALVIKVTT